MRYRRAMSLERALDELAKQRHEAALLALIEAWRARRSARIGALCDKASKLVKRRPLATSPIKKANERWHEIAADRDPLDLARLIAALGTGAVTAARKRIDVLATFPDDPRLAPALATFLAVAPYFESATATELIARAKEIILRGADERVLAVLAPYADRPSIAALLAEIRVTPVELTIDEQRACEAIEQLLGGQSADDLLAAIYDAPHDDGLRAVYADWLLEHGDEAYGEWIQLQLQPALEPDAQQRMDELWRSLERRLIAPFTKVTEPSSRVFKRGFLFRCAIRATNTRAVAAAAVAPEWQTVEELSVDGAYLKRDTLGLPAFRNVRKLSGITYDVLRMLAEGSPRPLEHVALHYIDATIAEAPTTEDAWTGVRNVVTLGLAASIALPTLAPLWATPFGRQLRRIELVDTADLAGWLANVPANVTELTVKQLSCRRVDGKWTIAVAHVPYVVTYSHSMPFHVDTIRTLLAGVPDATIELADELRGVL